MRLGLIGKGILNSSSPDLHVRLGELTGIPASYDLFDTLVTPIASLDSQVHDVMTAGYRGVNVTFPYKEEAVRLATRVGEGARLVGAANTLVFQNGEIRAENTDFTGFINGYRATVGERRPGRVLLIGTGGVGKAVAFGLGKLGAEEVRLMDLDGDKAERLARELVDAGFPASAVAPEALETTAAHCDGLVNCTPIGHEKSPGCPLPASLIRADQWIFDAVYVPAVTEFIAAARAAGAQVISGVSLFVFQGVDAFKVFCEDADKRALADAQAATLFDHYRHALLQEKDT
ncbi:MULTISPECIES: shikimate dehydrogenase [unclassified Modicisalibacter]|uniref:shikimate dehydrogenase family protein n=1 Tax=unclassified Modicisalibacter TaxID=2679913 RepID=UPI001CD0083E|nr:MULTISPECIES: shikimate dehydrogenase [unclassified Modicisalibacter]MBZ9557802.1 shikimate dehydrogenase [Modicisalibacter sp. R2A 31.J]MBZ9573533.1 shikimate dehydrogenase [Modicisalibacter sp. MOD 31.J]